MPKKTLFPQKKISEFCRRNHIRRLSVFGSRTRGKEKPDSDIDVLVEFEKGHTPGLAFLTWNGSCPAFPEKKST